MKCTKIVLTLLLFIFTSCECDEQLVRTCPLSEECWIPEGVENIESNLVLGGTFGGLGIVEGECSTGMTACYEDGTLFCDGVVYETEELCDFKDNDCDGLVDEGFDNDYDNVTTCGGDCDDTNRRVFPGHPEICDGNDNDCDGIIPLEETTDADGDGVIECRDCDDNNANARPGLIEYCDTIDNDCDGFIDENVIEVIDTCGPDTVVGVCERSRPICVNGEVSCPFATYRSGEVCDNLDNNCDGAKDEGLVQECSTICGDGFEFCDQGGWIGCNAPQPSIEICDGIDNDCNGMIDDIAVGFCFCLPGTVSLCASGVVDANGDSINCGIGTKLCDENGVYGDCIFAVATPEVCDAYDNDCDGIIDGMVNTCGDFEFAGIGECRLGTMTCENGVFSDCEDEVSPQTEVCDQKDNNCNGEIDENLNSHEKVDIVFAIDGSASMCQYVQVIASGLGQYVADFQNSEHRFALVIFPFRFGQVVQDIPWVVINNLVDVDQFLAALNGVSCVYPGVEPSYDVMFDLADNSNPVGIDWRGDAYPYIIMMQDERAQTWLAITEDQVALNTGDCRVGECAPGDKYEVYVFTNPQFFFQWDTVVFGELNRLIPIQPADASEYANKLRTVFANVCTN